MAATYESIAGDLVADTSDTSLVVTKPTGLSVGDIMIAVCGCIDARTVAAPGDWTSEDNTTDGSRRIQVYSKEADADDVAASDFTFTVSGGFANAGVVVVRISSAIDTGIVTEYETGANDTAIDCADITTPEDGCVVLWGFYQPTGPMTATIPAGATERIDSSNGEAVLYLATQDVASAGLVTGPTITKSGFGVARSFSIAISPSGGDVTAPELSSATIEADGETLTLVFDEDVTGDEAGFTLGASGGAVTASYDSGSGTDALVFTLSRVVYDTETVTLDYDEGTGTVEDLAENPLEDITDFAVTNDSEETDPGDTTPPTAGTWASNTAGTQITATLSESGCQADGGGSSGTGGFTLTGTPATVSGWSISGTTLTLSLTNLVYQGEVVTVAYARAGTTDDIKDAAGNYLADISATSVTNNSTQTGGGGVGGSFVGSAYVS